MGASGVTSLASAGLSAYSTLSKAQGAAPGGSSIGNPLQIGSLY